MACDLEFFFHLLFFFSFLLYLGLFALLVPHDIKAFGTSTPDLFCLALLTLNYDVCCTSLILQIIN